MSTLSAFCWPMHTSTHIGSSICAMKSCASLVIDTGCGHSSPSPWTTLTKGIRPPLPAAEAAGLELLSTPSIGPGAGEARRLPIIVWCRVARRVPERKVGRGNAGKVRTHFGMVSYRGRVVRTKADRREQGEEGKLWGICKRQSATFRN